MHNIIIKGMEMPTSCESCPCKTTDAFGGLGCQATGYIPLRKANQDRPDWCPLRPAPEWISVDYNNPETLPCTEKSILYCTFGKSVGEGYYRGFDGYHHVWKMYACCGTHWDYEVTHWMPLPEVPE